MPSATAPIDLERITEQYFAAWAARDPDRIVGLHTEDTRFQVHVGDAPAAVGREAARTAFADIFAQWPNFAFDTHRVLYGDGFWVLDWSLLSSGGPAGVVRLPCLDVVVVAPDGLVARKDTYVELPAPAGGAA